MLSKTLLPLLILSLFSFSNAAIKNVILSKIQNMRYEAFSILLRNGDWLCPMIREVMGNAEVNADVESIFFIHNTTEKYVSFKYSEAAATIASIAKENPDEKVVFVLHGFGDTTDNSTFNSIKEAFYLKGDKNIFYVDCREFISIVANYYQAMKNAIVASEALTKLLVQITNLGIDPSSITMVGHSLGAQMAGLIGKAYTKETGKKLAKITGLDPAGVCYYFLENSEKLTADDAEFVEIWLSDIKGYGYHEQVDIKPLGHADYYVNGGVFQPGSFMDSHFRVVLIYAESILNPKAFLGVKCDNYDQFKSGTCSDVTSYLNYNNDPSTRGIFYFQTLPTSPYGLGIKGATYNKEFDVEALLV